MIDLDLINQTENIATGTHLPWWMLIVCVAALIAVPAAGLGKYPLDMKLHELLLFEQKWGSLRSADDIQDAIDKNKNLTEGPRPSALASLLGAAASLFAAYHLGALWFAVTLAATSAVMLWLARRRLDAVKAAQIDNVHVQRVVRSHHEDAAFYALLAVGVSLVLISLVLAVPRIPDVDMAPTEAARAELTAAEEQIRTAVESSYDVEVLEDNSCTSWSSELTHEERAEFVEAALSDSPSADARLRLLTGDGVVGCYTVMYDQETQTARLVVDAEDTELTMPRELEKD